MLAQQRCEKNPIGKGDTLESRLWAFYRDWQDRTKNGSQNMRENSSKKSNFARMRLSKELLERSKVEI